MTGDVTTSANSFVTTIATGVVDGTKISTSVALAGTPTVGTPPGSTDSTAKIATTGWVQAFLDSNYSSTQGSILYRGASGWAALTPGTSGMVLQTNGSAANPSWATVSSAAPIGSAGGSLSGSYPNPGLANSAVTSAKIAAGAAVANIGYTPANIAGDTFTGNVLVTPSAANAQALLSKPTGAYSNGIYGRVGTSNRWNLLLGNADTESTGNAGSNVNLGRFSDAGSYIDSPFSVNRATGLVTLVDGLSVTGGGISQPGVINVLQAPYNAKCDGSTDDTTALQAALNAGVGGKVLIPNGNCYSSTGIVVPPNETLEGLVWLGGSSPLDYTGGSRITCPNTITSCVSLGNGTGGTGSVRNLVIQSTSSKATVGSGLVVNGLFDADLTRVTVNNFYIDLYWLAGNSYGLDGKMHQVYTGQAAAYHMFVDSWPELRISQSRFGSNGAHDYGAQSYIGFRNQAYSNPAAGVNSFVCESCQFNEGNGAFTVNDWLDFITYENGFPANDSEQFYFDNIHVENVYNGIYTGPTWNVFRDFKLTNSSVCLINHAITALGDLTNMIDTGTQIQGMVITNNVFTCGTMTLKAGNFTGPSGTSKSNLYMSGNTFLSGSLATAVSFTGNALGNAIIMGNNIRGTYTLTGAWNGLTSIGNQATALTMTATGNTSINDMAH
jgi:hypothetical protein